MEDGGSGLWDSQNGVQGGFLMATGESIHMHTLTGALFSAAFRPADGGVSRYSAELNKIVSACPMQ